MPQVTVLMSVYNGAATVREAIQSILGQSFSDFEFLVVDNASEDDTPSLLRSFSDPRLRIIWNKKNLGQTKALNLGIQEAAGKYIARMDADDISLPHRLETQVSYMEANPKAALVGGWHEEISETGAHKKIMRYPTNPLTIKANLLSDGNLTKRCFSHPTAFLRTAILRELGGYSEEIKFSQDYDLWIRLIRNHEIHNVDKVVLKYRVSSKSTSKKNWEAMTKELDRIVEKNISLNWPDIDEASKSTLVSMLRNKPVDANSSKTLLPLFDQFYDRFFKGNDSWGNAKLKEREKIKFYYLPRLFLKNPPISFAFFLKTILRWPLFLFDTKFQKNILKLAFQQSLN